MSHFCEKVKHSYVQTIVKHCYYCHSFHTDIEWLLKGKQISYFPANFSCLNDLEQYSKLIWLNLVLISLLKAHF